MLQAVPLHKCLPHAPSGIGLLVGNPTSQFFANVYLNGLDQYCKHTLKCRYYVRYCDVFLILDNNQHRLKQIFEEVRCFLAERLRLEMYDGNTSLYAINHAPEAR